MGQDSNLRAPTVIRLATEFALPIDTYITPLALNITENILKIVQDMFLTLFIVVTKVLYLPIIFVAMLIYFEYFIINYHTNYIITYVSVSFSNNSVPTTSPLY